MPGPAGQGGGWRGATSIALAYVFLLQVFLAGLAVSQMAFAATSDSTWVCRGGTSAGGPGGPAESPGEHAACCDLCAFSATSPLLPPPLATGLPERRVVAADLLRPGRTFAPPVARHEPRSSQGPPPGA